MNAKHMYAGSAVTSNSLLFILSAVVSLVVWLTMSETDLIKSLSKEIKDVNKLLVARAGVGNGETSALQKNFADALVKKIKVVKGILPEDGAALMAMLKDNVYGDDGTSKIMQAIEDKIKQSTVDSPGAPSMRCKNKPEKYKSHSLKHWWAYMSQDDWDFLNNKQQFFASNMSRAVERANSIGCTYPDEQTLKWMSAMLLMMHYGEAIPPANVIFDKLHELKLLVESERKIWPESLDGQEPQAYPATPHGLVKPVFDHAYPDVDNGPKAVELAGISAVAERIPLRSNSKLLKGLQSPAKVKQEPPGGLSISADGGCTMHGLDVKHVKIEPGQAATSLTPSPTPNQMPSQDDPQEMALWSQYKADLWKLRAQKQGLLQVKTEYPQSDTAMKQEPLGGAIHVATTPEGGYVLRPRVSLHIGTSAAPAATAAKTEPASEKGPDDATKGADATKVADDDELDPHAKAAIAAMESVVSKRAEVVKHRAAAKRAAAKAAKIPATKRESSQQMHSAKRSCGEVVEVTADKISAACPTGLSGPVFYNGGVIYTVTKSKMFRALRVRGDKWIETQGRWGGLLSVQEAWQKCVDAIDKHKNLSVGVKVKKDVNKLAVKKEGKFIKAAVRAKKHMVKVTKNAVKPKKHKKC